MRVCRCGGAAMSKCALSSTSHSSFVIAVNGATWPLELSSRSVKVPRISFLQVAMRASPCPLSLSRYRRCEVHRSLRSLANIPIRWTPVASTMPRNIPAVVNGIATVPSGPTAMQPPVPALVLASCSAR